LVHYASYFSCESFLLCIRKRLPDKLMLRVKLTVQKRARIV
jgi:hypothetical protein